MCGVMEKYLSEEREKGIMSAVQLLIKAHMTEEEIVKIGYTAEDYKKAEEALLVGKN